MNYSYISRTRILSLCVLLFSLVLIAKLFLLQVVHSKYYEEQADRQYSTPSADIFERGTIFFKRKDGQLVSAAVQASGYKLAINPSKLIDKKITYQKLSKILPLDEDQFMLKAGKSTDPYEEVANNLTKGTADDITALKLTGVNIYKEKWRFYPGKNLASQGLGFVGYNENELGGRYGLEREYDLVLSRSKNNPYVNFFAEVFSNVGKTLFKDEVKEGDVVTTIEPDVQSFLEKELSIVKEKYNTDSVGGIIMNPQDGSIYALSSKPDFDPNNFSKAKSISVFSNPLVENVYEFGSVVKPLVMAGALDLGLVNADTTYNDKGSVIIEKKEITNFDKKGRGQGTTMQEVLNQSLNTGMVFVYQKMGKKNLRDYLLSYGIKDKTGIDLPNETSGLVSNIVKVEREFEYANASFGQGIALTPVELVRALATLGNGGNLVVPHMVEEIKYDDGTKKSFTYPTSRAKISEKTSEEITRMLVQVMDKSIKGGKGKIDNHSVAVKTGTAQVANNVTGGYYKDRHTHSFFGYFPAYDSKFIIFLYAVNPKGVAYAAQTWSDPFLNTVKFLINYYEIPPDR